MYNENPGNDFYRQEQAGYTDQSVALYLARVMGWMCLGLFTTLVTSFVCLVVPSIFQALYRGAYMGVFVAQLVVVLILSFAMRKLSPAMATVLFMGYAALTGITFTSLFIVFEALSLLFVAGITGCIFLFMSIYGFVTKRDLTRMGSLALFGLLGIIVAGLANLFMRNSMLDFAITIIGVVVFIALIAYDTQKIKGFYIDAMSSGYSEDSPIVRKMAIYGAFTLYLDFINLFLKLLRLLGRRRS